LCNAIQLMEATKLIDYIYMQYIFLWKQKYAVA
jgi:hypothetical protein